MIKTSKGEDMGAAKSGWISAEEIPVEECEAVLLVVSDETHLDGEGYYEIGYIHNDEWFEWRTNNKIENDVVKVMYWKPLPFMPG